MEEYSITSKTYPKYPKWKCLMWRRVEFSLTFVWKPLIFSFGDQMKKKDEKKNERMWNEAWKEERELCWIHKNINILYITVLAVHLDIVEAWILINTVFAYRCTLRYKHTHTHKALIRPDVQLHLSVLVILTQQTWAPGIHGHEKYLNKEGMKITQ